MEARGEKEINETKVDQKIKYVLRLEDMIDHLQYSLVENAYQL